MTLTRRGIVSSGLAALLILVMTASLALARDQGRFTVREINGTWWLIDPHGTPMFSRGVCCVNTGIPWEKHTIANPGYAAWQQYPSAEAWAGATMDSLRSWGFTTIGGWSDIDLFLRSGKLNLPFTVVLHCGSSAGVPWFDMWDPEIITRVDEVAREQILKTRDHPLLIGYYSDNELGWWNAMLFKMTWEHAPKSGARARLLNLVREHYRNSWPSMTKDFDPEGASNFAELARRGRLFLRPGGKGIIVVQKFMTVLADRYYGLMKETIRKYSDRALYLGDRYQSFYYPEVVKAAGRHVDVLSTNMGMHFYDGTPTRYYLSTLYELAQKPIMIGEYYMAATENRSGNKNTGTGFPTVNTQGERVKGFLTTVTRLVRTPYIIGADWFQYFDEPTHGREDGEDFNFGLVDISGKPYEELTNASRTFDWQGLKSSPQLGERRLQILEGVVAMRAGVEKEEQQHRTAARRGEIESLLLVEYGGRELGRDRAIARNRIVLSREAERLADLRFDDADRVRTGRRELPDRPDEIALRVDAEQRGGYPEAQALRDAAGAIVDHRKIEAVLRRIAFGLRAIGPDRDTDDVEVVIAAELGDPRNRIADRDRGLVPPDRRSRRPGACRCASRCRGARRRASSPRMRAAASPRGRASSAASLDAGPSFPVNPRRRTRARARLRAIRKRAPAPVTLRAAG